MIFDIDGTLLATDAFWLDVGRRGVRTVYLRHGINRALPENRFFLEAIGKPMKEFWEFVLPPDLHSLGDEIEAECEELEEAAFLAGKGAFYPGARALLEELHAQGVQVALASNCSRRYLESFIGTFQIQPILSAAYCAESPGIRSKGDMVTRILQEMGTREAIMIGDRESDRQAAKANDIPFLLFTGGFGGTPAADEDLLADDYTAVRRQLLVPSPRA